MGRLTTAEGPARHPLDGYRLVIFDADDTLRRTTGPNQPCPHRADEWELLPNVRTVLARVPWMRPDGPRLGLASNQDHVGYGHLSIELARSLLRDLAVAATGIVPPDAALQLCPHALETDCKCRKPKPAMLQRIMQHYGIAPGETVFVGNSEADRHAAAAAGVAFIAAAELFSSHTAAPSARRTPRTPPPAAAGWCDGA